LAGQEKQQLRSKQYKSWSLFWLPELCFTQLRNVLDCHSQKSRQLFLLDFAGLSMWVRQAGHR
jgi:hypothetical protein